eukprot:scaffold161725_cov30-Tisochrysis_lutea.AAC.3
MQKRLRGGATSERRPSKRGREGTEEAGGKGSGQGRKQAGNSDYNQRAARSLARAPLSMW